MPSFPVHIYIFSTSITTYLLNDICFMFTKCALPKSLLYQLLVKHATRVSISNLKNAKPFQRTWRGSLMINSWGQKSPETCLKVAPLNSNPEVGRGQGELQWY